MNSSHIPLLFAAACMLTACAEGASSGEPLDATSTQQSDGAADTRVQPDSTVSLDATATTSGPDTSTSADGSADADVDPACAESARPFECPCESDAECASGLCVDVNEAGTTGRCSKPCTDSCGLGWTCADDAVRGTRLCLPAPGNICLPCTANNNCGVANGVCVGGHCLLDCQHNAAWCPAGYTCDGNGLCQPDSGACSCGDGIDFGTDPANCGGCNNVCAFPSGIPGCANGTCILAGCELGTSDADGDPSNGCEAQCQPTGEDWPESACTGASCDQNCDGIDGDISRAIFVSLAGRPDGLGSPQDPVDNIAAALSLAASGSKDHVYVAAGTYPEQVELVEGISLFGGYDDLWGRDVTANPTMIAPTATGPAVRADGVTARTVFDGFSVTAASASASGDSSYAVWVRDSTEALELTSVTATAGDGAAGTDGGPGGTGAPGGTASNGVSTTTTDCWCDDWSSYGGPGGAGGANACSEGTSAAGGRGGDSGCGSNDPDSDAGATSPGGAMGGTRDGGPGASGADGGTGGHGAGGPSGGSVDAAGFWMGRQATPGNTGANGVGGGGGGGGDGDSNGISCASWGGGGGGGGGGGCGGTGGQPGQPGGGSFALFLVDASPTLSDLTLATSTGGNGGRGGAGGGGGDGKPGKAGGNGDRDADNGGMGGAGGNGGSGGSGGGGAGGPAFGLYLAGASDPVCQGLSFVGTPIPGAGGAPGASAGNPGSAGDAGERNTPTTRCP